LKGEDNVTEVEERNDGGVARLRVAPAMGKPHPRSHLPILSLGNDNLHSKVSPSPLQLFSLHLAAGRCDFMTLTVICTSFGIKSEAIMKNECLRQVQNLKVQHDHIIPF
jgi:hypothetical protein